MFTHGHWQPKKMRQIYLSIWVKILHVYRGNKLPQILGFVQTTDSSAATSAKLLLTAHARAVMFLVQKHVLSVNIFS